MDNLRACLFASTITIFNLNLWLANLRLKKLSMRDSKDGVVVDLELKR